MKRPDRMVLHEVVRVKKDGWVDFNGKEAVSYFIEIPYFIGRAYSLNHKRVQVIVGDTLSLSEINEDRNLLHTYFKSNWREKIAKMRRLNHNYLLVGVTHNPKHLFDSIEDYEDYHRELKLLNKKYMKSGE